MSTPALPLSTPAVAPLSPTAPIAVAPQPIAPPLLQPAPSRARPLSAEDEARREQLVALLAQHGGNISEVARQLGRERIQIRRWIKRYGIAGYEKL